MPGCEVGYFLFNWGILRSENFSELCFQCCEGIFCEVHNGKEYTVRAVQYFADEDFKLVDEVDVYNRNEAAALFDDRSSNEEYRNVHMVDLELICADENTSAQSVGKLPGCKKAKELEKWDEETNKPSSSKPPRRKKCTRFREQIYVCDVCEQGFTLKENVARHLFRFHVNPDGSLREKGGYKCDECNQIFRSVGAADQHFQKKHGSKKNAKILSECEQCGKTFTSAFQLREHISIQHLKERNYKCGLCQQRFGRRGGLRRHIQMVHNNHVHKCPYETCDHPGYKCSKALTAHIRSVHTNDRPFVCPDCPKTFVRKNDLKMHSQVHSTDRTFVCPCGARFRRQIYLRKHSKTCSLAVTAVSISEGGSPASDWPPMDEAKPTGLLSLPLTPELRLSDEPLNLKKETSVEVKEEPINVDSLDGSVKAEEMSEDDEDSESALVVVD